MGLATSENFGYWTNINIKKSPTSIYVYSILLIPEKKIIKSFDPQQISVDNIEFNTAQNLKQEPRIIEKYSVL